MNRTLRPKKDINYLEIVQDKGHVSSITSISNQSTQGTEEAKTSEHESEEYVSSDKSDSESETGSDSDEYSSKKKKRKLNVSTAEASASYLAILAENEEDDDEDEYKLQREKSLRDRQNILKTMDLDDEINELGIKILPSPIRTPVIPARKKSQPVRRSQKPARSSKSTENTNLRKSMRIITRSFTLSNPNYKDDGVTNGSGYDKRDEIIEEDLDLAIGDDDKDFFESIKELPDTSYDSISDFVSCDYDKFSKVIESCRMYQEPKKIIPSRITSLDFHKSESKLLLVAGDKHGHVSLWSLEMDKGITLKPHGFSANCVSFSGDGTKFYSTALDGTTRIGDIELRNSTLLYKSEDEEHNDESHTTWHHEFGQQLLIARGDGNVKLLDLRAPTEKTPLYKCHKRSVRTVQVNPKNDSYFLTSSGVGEFGVFDLRQNGSKQSRIMLKNQGKALTSAFYSAKGSYVLTTSNDDTIRVYDCRDNKAYERTSIPHNNHGGRWLSVIKARWQPHREDCFYVGSLLAQPKRIQAYTVNGKILYQFTSPMMGTYTPVVTIHPTKPIIVGGNASGKIHVYSPFKDLQNQVL